MTRIKICGIKEESHALAAAEAGADFIGLVFASSPRQITVEKARSIASILRAKTKARVVGVFVNETAYEVNRIAESCPLDFVQLSGDESWDYCLDINKPVIKAVKVGGQKADELHAELARGIQILKEKECLYLLDTKADGIYGGAGKAFDWTIARQLSCNFSVIIAGGLAPENVCRAIQVTSPWGVDASSGVEINGVKSIAKVKAFIEAVRGCHVR